MTDDIVPSCETWEWDWRDRQELAPVHELQQRIKLLELHIAYTRRWPFEHHLPSRADAFERIERYSSEIAAQGFTDNVHDAVALLDEMRL